MRQWKIDSNSNPLIQVKSLANGQGCQSPAAVVVKDCTLSARGWRERELAFPANHLLWDGSGGLRLSF
jgi:hypothetical protein